MGAYASLFLVKSQFVRAVSSRESALVWHSLFGKLKAIPNTALSLLDEFRTPKSWGDQTNAPQVAMIEEFVNSYFLVPVDFDERSFLKQETRKREDQTTTGAQICQLGLVVSEACNFRCNYCIHFNSIGISKRMDSACKFMCFEVAKEAVDKYLAILRRHQKTKARISFSGGEPLLAWSVIEQVLEYCKADYGTEFTFQFSLTTNASLITPDIAQSLKRYDVGLASSIDGSREGNDHVRVTNTGKGTYEMIIWGLHNLEAAEYPLRVVGATINGLNYHCLDETIVDLAIKHKISTVRIDVDVIGTVDVPIEEVVKKIMSIRTYAKSKGVDVSGFWDRPFKNLKKSTIDSRGVAFCGAVQGKTLCVGPSGAIYACGYSNLQIGTLGEIDSLAEPGGKYQELVSRRLTGEPEFCRGCMIEGQCGGGCEITQEFAQARTTAKVELMCDFFRQMTRELLFERLEDG